MSDLKGGPKLSRREYIKIQAVAAAFAAAGLPNTAAASKLKTAAQEHRDHALGSSEPRA